MGISRSREPRTNKEDELKMKQNEDELVSFLFCCWDGKIETFVDCWWQLVHHTPTWRVLETVRSYNHKLEQLRGAGVVWQLQTNLNCLNDLWKKLRNEKQQLCCPPFKKHVKHLVIKETGKKIFVQESKYYFSLLLLFLDYQKKSVLY